MDTAAIDTATERASAAGIRVLNAFLLADNEQDHATHLLQFMHPPEGAVVLDAGCGTGALARLMREQRPDLTFKLLNASAAQLAQCPQGMERILADFAATGLPDESVDVVMFAFSLSQAPDWWAALREARRVLKEGGVLFIFDMEGEGVDNTLAWHLLRTRVFPGEQVASIARTAGFHLEQACLHAWSQSRLRDVFPSQALYDDLFGSVVPVTMRFTRRTIADPIASAMERHDRIAFQFSGGRDSTAALHLLKPWWDRLTVYHLDTGDQFPELRDVVETVELMLPRRIVRIRTDVVAARERDGWPSDVVPVDNTAPGRLVSGRPMKITGRYECCWRNLMAPMHQRMVDDGITLIIRGQRDDEYANPPLRSGDVAQGMEVLYPVQGWTGLEVQGYLERHSLPVAPFYERGARRAPECMGCTAWWDEGRMQYLRQFHPLAHAVTVQRMTAIRHEIDRQLAMLEG